VIAYVVLIIIILIAVVNLAFAMKSPATPIYTPSNIDIRRQFVQRDESKWLKVLFFLEFFWVFCVLFLGGFILLYIKFSKFVLHLFH